MNSLEYTNIQGFKLAMRALLGGTFLPVQRTCKKKAKFSYRLSDPAEPAHLEHCECTNSRYANKGANNTKLVCHTLDNGETIWFGDKIDCQLSLKGKFFKLYQQH